MTQYRFIDVTEEGGTIVSIRADVIIAVFDAERDGQCWVRLAGSDRDQKILLSRQALLARVSPGG